jgi:hypothetical protein
MQKYTYIIQIRFTKMLLGRSIACSETGDSVFPNDPQLEAAVKPVITALAKSPAHASISGIAVAPNIWIGV